MEKVLIFAAFVAAATAAVVQEFDMINLEPAIVHSASSKKNYGFKPMIRDEDFGVK